MNAAPPPLLMTSDESLDRINARLSFFETSLDQLKKDLPKYVHQIGDQHKCTTQISKAVKAVASSEPHSALQFFLFLFATKHEELAESARSFEDLSKATKETLDSWEKQLISPMKAVVHDHAANLKRLRAKATANSNSNNNAANNNQQPSDPNNNNPAQPTMTNNNEPAGLDIISSVLPIHAKLFEKHRVQGLKSLFKDLLLTEIKYHAKAMESYSQLLECLHAVDALDGHDLTR